MMLWQATDTIWVIQGGGGLPFWLEVTGLVMNTAAAVAVAALTYYLFRETQRPRRVAATKLFLAAHELLIDVEVGLVTLERAMMVDAASKSARGLALSKCKDLAERVIPRFKRRLEEGREPAQQVSPYGLVLLHSIEERLEVAEEAIEQGLNDAPADVEFDLIHETLSTVVPPARKAADLYLGIVTGWRKKRRAIRSFTELREKTVAEWLRIDEASESQ